MSNLPKRYVFSDYESLLKVDFAKLRKVCNKVFILVDPEIDSIPVEVVIQAQSLGKRVKWIAAEDEAETGFHHHLSFLLGQMHERTESNVEFAVLSDSDSLDTLIHFINEDGRSCLRVKTQAAQEEGPENIQELRKKSESNFNEGESAISPIRSIK